MGNRRLTQVVIFLVMTLFVGAAVVGLDLYRLLYQPMPIGSQESVIIRIDKSMSAATFVRALRVQNLIQSSKLFLFLIRGTGLATELKAGMYQILPGETALQLLHRVVHGEVLTETFRVIEGTTQKQIAVNLSKAPYLNYKATDWLSISNKNPSVEGELLADTYRYDALSDAHALLARAHDELQTVLNENWAHRSPNLPYKTPYELLIVASILEKEAALPTERRLISGIIVNRLRQHMPLQMDPTVIYALGEHYTGQLTHASLQVDSPYNSYKYRGLPPGPIAMVGKDAIDASAHPLETNYLYFVAKGDGSHEFSVTYEDQRRAIVRYVRKA